jgi:hypothetical protein
MSQPVLMPCRCYSEKNQVPRELALITISLAYLVAQWNSYGGSWKWVTILHILVAIVQLLFAICFCILHMCTNNCIHLIVKFCTSLLSSVFGASPGAGFHFWKGTYNFQNCLRIHLYRCVHIKVHWKMFHPFYPPPFSPIICPLYRI